MAWRVGDFFIKLVNYIRRDVTVSRASPERRLIYVGRLRVYAIYLLRNLGGNLDTTLSEETPEFKGSLQYRFVFPRPRLGSLPHRW